MKKYLIRTLIATSLISSTLGQVAFASNNSIIPHTTIPISDNHINTTTTIVNDPNGQFSTITTVYNKRVTTYTSTSTLSKDGITSTVDASFIDDKNSSEMTTILNLKGFIPSGLTYNPFNIDEIETAGILLWPCEYRVQASTSTPYVQIAESFPKNTVETSEINNSVSYSLSGGIEVTNDGPKASANGSVAFSQSSSYSQPEYKTVQSINTNNDVNWNIVFHRTRDGYSLNDNNILYGNQMFMKSRYRNNAQNNLTPKSDLSPLMSGGFSPNMGLVLTAPNGTKKSTIKISLSRLSKLYYLQWTSTEWTGANISSNDFDQNKEFVFEIDWENHTIRSNVE